MKETSEAQLKKRRSVFVAFVVGVLILLGFTATPRQDTAQEEPQPEVAAEQSGSQESEPTGDVLADTETVLAVDALQELDVKGRAPKTGYSRDEFGDGWIDINGCSLRDIMLSRGLTKIELADDNCTVLSGTLQDPYTQKIILFTRGSTTSADVQIDHVVALSDSWQKGAQQLDFSTRIQLANDPLNLLAVDGNANQQKGDSDAASWLPSNTSYRCIYVARQIAVKAKYNLWVTEAEQAAMQRILNGCGDQVLPVER